MLDKLILTLAKFLDLESICDIKVRLLVHVQYPCIRVGAYTHCGLVQCTCLEEGVAGRGLVTRHHDLVHTVVVRPQVHPSVGHYLHNPIRDISYLRVVHCLLDVN